MFCQNCGTFLEEGVKFCPNCGTPIAVPEVVAAAAEEKPVEPRFEEPAPTVTEPVYEEPAQPAYQQPEPPVYQPEAPVYQEPVVKSNPAAEALSSPILVFGILGVAFCCMPYLLSILGIIFSAIAKKKVKAFQEAGGVLSGKAKVGNILAKVGMIVSIVMTAIFVVVIIAAIIAAIANYN